MKKVMLLICLFVLVCAFHLSAQMGPSCYEGSLNDSSNGKYLQQLLSPSFDSNNLRTYLFDCSAGDFYIDCGNQYKEKFSGNAIVKQGSYGLAITTNADKTPLIVTLDKPIKEPTIWLDVDLYEDASEDREFVFTYENGAEDRLKWDIDYNDITLSNGVDPQKSIEDVWNRGNYFNTIRFTLDNKNNVKIYLNYNSTPLWSFKSQGNGSALKSFEISPLYSNELVYNLEILSSPQKISNCASITFDVESILNTANNGNPIDDYGIKYGVENYLVINKGPADKTGITPNGDYTYMYKFDLNGGNDFSIILDVDLYEDASQDREFVFRYTNGAEDRLKWDIDYNDIRLSNGVVDPKTIEDVWNRGNNRNTIRFEKTNDLIKIFLNSIVDPIYSFKSEGNCLQELEFRLYSGEWIYGFSL